MVKKKLDQNHKVTFARGGGLTMEGDSAITIWREEGEELHSQSEEEVTTFIPLLALFFSLCLSLPHSSLLLWCHD